MTADQQYRVTNLTDQQVARGRALCKALRTNCKKAINRMRTPDGGRCCLAVALDTAIEDGFVVPPRGENTNHTADEYPYLPPFTLASWYGWDNQRSTRDYFPMLQMPGYYATWHPAGIWNDGDATYRLPPFTHAQIADAFENTFPQLKDRESNNVDSVKTSNSWTLQFGVELAVKIADEFKRRQNLNPFIDPSIIAVEVCAKYCIPRNDLDGDI